MQHNFLHDEYCYSCQFLYVFKQQEALCHCKRLSLLERQGGRGTSGGGIRRRSIGKDMDIWEQGVIIIKVKGGLLVVIWLNWLHWQREINKLLPNLYASLSAGLSLVYKPPQNVRHFTCTPPTCTPPGIDRWMDPRGQYRKREGGGCKKTIGPHGRPTNIRHTFTGREKSINL